MRSSNFGRARKLWVIGLTAAVVWAVPAALRGQSIAISDQAALSTVQPFAGFDHSLAEAANALLGSVTQEAAAKGGGITATSGVIDTDRRPQLLDEGRLNSAGRLYLLRSAMEPILRNNGVPADLVGVVLVESGGRATALSSKGARGLWQLMPDTARHYGLRVDDVVDDRLDLFKATDAAARYFHDLYTKFGDWKLALAAYNAGEAAVTAALLRTHSVDFDQLTSLRTLPLETRNYVPRVLAAIQSSGQLSTFGEHHPAAIAITVFAVSHR